MLIDVGIEFSVFSSLQANPRDTEVMEAARQYKDSGCDLIVAIGGGSPMDCAKAIGIVSTNKKHIFEFDGVDNVDVPGPPLIWVQRFRVHRSGLLLKVTPLNRTFF